VTRLIIQLDGLTQLRPTPDNALHRHSNFGPGNQVAWTATSRCKEGKEKKVMLGK